MHTVQDLFARLCEVISGDVVWTEEIQRECRNIREEEVAKIESRIFSSQRVLHLGTTFFSGQVKGFAQATPKSRVDLNSIDLADTTHAEPLVADGCSAKVRESDALT